MRKSLGARREAVSEEAIASYELVLFEDGVPYKRYRYGTEEGYLFRYLDGERTETAFELTVLAPEGMELSNPA